jgi:hypothetical protein
MGIRQTIGVVAGALLAAAVVVGLSNVAWAGLGGDSNSLDVTKLVYGGSRGPALAHSGYTVNQLVNGRLTIWEYICADSGKVCKVAWFGPGQPPLDSLLGDALTEFKTAYQARVLAATGPPRVRVPRDVMRTPNLLIDRYGRPGHMGGFACLLNLLPEGKSCDDIR